MLHVRHWTWHELSIRIRSRWGDWDKEHSNYHGLTSLLTVPMCTSATGSALLSARPYVCGSLSLSISLWEVTRTNLWVRPFYWWDYEKKTSFKPLDICHFLILNRITCIWLIKGLKNWCTQLLLLDSLCVSTCETRNCYLILIHVTLFTFNSLCKMYHITVNTC